MSAPKQVGKRIARGSIVAAVFLSAGLRADEAGAIPAFARKFQTACNTCHVPSFPKLNDFGNGFRDQGYQMGNADDLPTSPKISPGYWPVALRTTVGYQYAHAGGKGNSANVGGFGFTGMDLLSFGVLARDISFGLVFAPGLGSAGFGTSSTVGEEDLEAAFVRFDN